MSEINKYYLRSDRTAVCPTMEEPNRRNVPDYEYFLTVWDNHLLSLPSLTVDPAYLETLSPGWFEGDEKYEIEYQKHPDEPYYWVKCSKDEYESCNKVGGDCRLTIIAPQEAEKGQEGEVDTMTLEELLEYMPPCIDQEDKTYCLHFFKGTSGFIVEYSHVEENIHVDLQGVKFTKKTNLFDTFRMDKSLPKAIISFLTLLIDNKDKLRFIPRIHPLNNNK